MSRVFIERLQVEHDDRQLHPPETTIDLRVVGLTLAEAAELGKAVRAATATFLEELT